MFCTVCTAKVEELHVGLPVSLECILGMVVVDTTMEWQPVSKAVCAGSNMSLVGFITRAMLLLPRKRQFATGCVLEFPKENYFITRGMLVFPTKTQFATGCVL